MSVLNFEYLYLKHRESRKKYRKKFSNENLLANVQKSLRSNIGFHCAENEQVENFATSSLHCTFCAASLKRERKL